MGLDIIAYSNVKSEPIPTKYRGKKKTKKKFNINKARMNIMKNTGVAQADKSGILALAMILNGAENSYLDEEFEEKDDIDISYPDVSKESYEWYKKESSKHKAIHANWKSNVIYYKTKDTKEYSTYGSYSGFGIFCSSIQEFTKKRFYFPCDAMLDQSICEKYQNILEDVWHKWISKHTKLGKVKDLEDVYESLTYNEENYDLDRYLEVYRTVKLGAECGILFCC